MIDIKFNLNLTTINSYLNRVGKKIDSRLEQAKLEIGRFVLKDAKRYAPLEGGDLEQSIRSSVKCEDILFYVPRSSKAGKYAKWRHDKGPRRDVGDERKGTKAGSRFIFRAIFDNEKKIEDEISSIFRRL
jgi:hypothetical protein